MPHEAREWWRAPIDPLRPCPNLIEARVTGHLDAIGRYTEAGQAHRILNGNRAHRVKPPVGPGEQRSHPGAQARRIGSDSRAHQSEPHPALQGGRIVSVNVSPGQQVTAGQVLVIVEAMKMEHVITCAEDGIVTEVRVVADEQVEAGHVLLVVDTGKDEP